MSFLSVLAETLGNYERDGPEWKLQIQGRTLLIGNGGSAAIAAHIANDLNKSGRPALTVDTATLACFANDYGWEWALQKWTEVHLRPEDTLIAISSSGNSENIYNACLGCNDGNIVTFTGFEPDNRIRKLGHTNYYVPSHNYGIVECAHLAILHSIVNPGEL